MINEGMITVNGKQLFYRQIAPEKAATGRPVLVFLHEGLGSTEQWKDFPETIASLTNCSALVYDRFGYGKSDIKIAPNSPLYMHTEAYVFLPELLEKLEIRNQVILIGHSDGGTIALLFAARFPEQTLAIITECDHVICERITIQGVLGLVNDYQRGRLKKQLALFHGNKTDTLFYGWTGLWLSESGESYSIVETLPKVLVPVLAIQGTLDHFGSTEQLAVKLKHLGGPVQINLLPECGHVPHFQAIKTVTQLMTDFIHRYV
jgi:pimeloyl-ACP methyl ester carboxylesterase